MAEDQPNKIALTGGKREEQDVTTTMTTTSCHHPLAERENMHVKKLKGRGLRGSGSKGV